MAKYLFTEEWNESDILPHGRCTEHVTAYGKKTEKEIREIVDCMNRYSPYDYATYSTFTNESKYKLYLGILERNGSTITKSL